MTRREIALKIAWHYLGTPYIWGGDDPEGFDCSGFVVEVLKSVGELPRKGDWTADSLFYRLRFSGCVGEGGPGEGRLVFFYNRAKDKFEHVEICVDYGLSIGASGGGSSCVDTKTAMLWNAFIKVRPFTTDKREKVYIDPFV